MVVTSSASPLSSLLSQMTGQEVTDKHITPKILFIAALTTVLVGVAFADGQLTDEEKQSLQRILNQLIPGKSPVGQLVRLMVKGVREQKIYAKIGPINQLTQSFSESEKLLLIAFCYEMSATDGAVADQEEKYIRQLGQGINVRPSYLDTLGLRFRGAEISSELTDEILVLLNPQRFQHLDPVFVNAAKSVCSRLSEQHGEKKAQCNSNVQYGQLAQYQHKKSQLESFCIELGQVIQNCIKNDFIPESLGNEVERLSNKLKSQRFRLSVIGEFSRGKSTLLNALMGEEVQPVRAIPCSGTITVLRHGTSRRVICRYRNGQEEEVPFEQYQDKASIPEQSAMCNLSTELAQSQIEEIVLEHPGLGLCRHQVEIVDSPGLNEHPDRTAVTQKILQDTDAVIFLSSALQPFTQGERELLQEVCKQLNYGKTAQAVENLFVVVNFIDLLRREKDQVQVRQLAENLVHGEGVVNLVKGQERLHLISAQAALDAMLESSTNEHSAAFQNFMNAVENFLTQERGAIALRQIKDGLKGIIQETRESLEQTEDLLEGKVKTSEEEQKAVLEQIGEASGRSIRIGQTTSGLNDTTIDKVIESWQVWQESIADRLIEKSNSWNTDSDQKEKIKSQYYTQFMRDLSQDIDAWLENEVKCTILGPNLEVLDSQIHNELLAVRKQLELLDSTVGSTLSEQFSLSLSNLGVNLNFGASLNSSDDGDGSWIIGAGGGIFAGAVLGAIGFGFLPIVLAGGAIGAAIGWLFGEDPAEVRQKLKGEVLQMGFDKFSEVEETLLKKIFESIDKSFQQRAERAKYSMEYLISMLNNLLEIQQKMHQEMVGAKNSDKILIQQSKEKLSQIESRLDSFLSTTV